MASNPNYCDITPEIEALAAQALRNSSIDPDDFVKYDVKRGLRDLNGKGVLAGLTEVSDIVAKKIVDGEELPCDGKLYYRGVDVEQLVEGALKEGRFGFEETAYLLLLGHLPNQEELESFTKQLSYYRSLPNNFVRDVILKAPSHDIMNSLARSVLNLASYDDRADDLSLPNVMRQCVQLISLFPMLSVYGYQAWNYKSGSSLYIHAPRPELSAAENILSLLRADSTYSFWEAHVLDICLTLHAEHGGGNNSTFTTHVVTSSGTDTYSCMAAALASLKGPKHGGANIKVVRMFEDMKEQVKDWKDEDEVRRYLQDLLDKKAFDKAGLIYGMGHAVYSLSDPRASQPAPLLCGEAVPGEGPQRGVRTLLPGGAAGPRGYRRGAEDVQGRVRQRGLLLRLRVPHAGPASGAVYSHLRHGPYRRLVRPPHRGADQYGQDHSPGL